MSLFGSLMGDLEDDPFFGAHMRTMRQMNSMMNSMFGDPFGFMGPPALTGGSRALEPHATALTGGRRHGHGTELMPFGFMNMNRLFSDFDQMGNNPNCHSYSSSTVMTMTSGPDGRPQVYQASSSTRTAPGGVKETKKTMCDSRTGVKKMAIGHHIGERAHVLEREQNLMSGDQEERQEFINLEEEEADEFNREFEQKTRRVTGAIGYYPGSRHPGSGHRRERENLQALPPATSTASCSGSLSQAGALGSHPGAATHARGPTAPVPAASPIPAPAASGSAAPAAAGGERARKRGHEPEGAESHKSLKPSHQGRQGHQGQL